MQYYGKIAQGGMVMEEVGAVEAAVGMHCSVVVVSSEVGPFTCFC